MSEQTPIFRGIFGADWDRLLPVFRQHYANRPFSHDVVVVEGVMDVELSWLARLFAPLMRFSGALVPVAGRDIPVMVTFRSDPDSPSFAFDREFRFPGRKPYHFRSVMLPAGGNEVIEWMAIGFGWRAAFSYGEGQVRLEHRGYDRPPLSGPVGMLVHGRPRRQRGRRSWMGFRRRPSGHGGYKDLRSRRLVPE